MSWYKDGARIRKAGDKKTRIRLLTDNRQRSHHLSIRGVEEEDYGNYTCSASNNLGTTTHNILLTGII